MVLGRASVGGLGFRLTLACVLAGCPLAAVGWGQQSSTQLTESNSGTYTLDQTVRAVVLDVTVVDRQGHPVTGLKAEQFHVSEDGVGQRVRFFEGPPAHALPATAESKEGAALLRSSGEAPLTLLVLDHISTEPEDLLYAKKQIAEYLAKQPARLLSPTALMALTSSTILPLSDYTLDRDKLIAAIHSDHEPASWYVLRDRQPGFKATGLTSSGERLAIYVGVLNELATSLASYPVRKNLVWVGPGLPAFDQVLAQRADGPQQIEQALRPVVTRLVRARVSMYTVDPQGLMVTPTEMQGMSMTGSGGTQLFGSGGDPAEKELAFEQLAPETGGRIFRMRNDVGAAIGESVEDGSQFYTISYDPANGRYDGSFRKIRVTVDDPALRVRTQEGYLAVPPERKASDAGAQAMAFALTSNLAYQGVETAASLARGATPPAVHVVVSTGDLHWIADPADPNRMLATISLVTANLNRDGKVLDYAVLTQHARAAETATHGTKAEFVVPVKTDAKATRLRVIVRDQGTGRLGSADIALP